LRKFNGHRFAPFVVLDGDHGCFRGATFSSTFESHTIVKLQRQRREEDSEISGSKFDGGGFAQFRATAAERSHLHGNANRNGLREKPRELLSATLFLIR
jgi:hypothetical protein